MVAKLQWEELCWPLSIGLNDGNPDNGTFTYFRVLKLEWFQNPCAEDPIKSLWPTVKHSDIWQSLFFSFYWSTKHWNLRTFPSPSPYNDAFPCINRATQRIKMCHRDIFIWFHCNPPYFKCSLWVTRAEEYNIFTNTEIRTILSMVTKNQFKLEVLYPLEGT